MSEGDRDPAIPAAARARHDEAVVAGRDTYRDPQTGFSVWTAAFLERRGRCCGSGCRHCPYSADQQRAAGRPRISAG